MLFHGFNRYEWRWRSTTKGGKNWEDGDATWTEGCNWKDTSFALVNLREKTRLIKRLTSTVGLKKMTSADPKKWVCYYI